MKGTGFSLFASLVGVAAAGRCKHGSSTLITSIVSSMPAISSVPASPISVSSSLAPPSSSVLSSSVLSSPVLSSSAPPSSSTAISSSEPACGGGQCLAAITAEPAVGDAFCSLVLSQTPATTVITETETVTSTHTNLETASTVLTLTTDTVTQISGTTTVFAKRADPSDTPSDPSDLIVSECSFVLARISSACSCHLAGSTTSTVTLYETTTETAVPEYTTTTTEILTTHVTHTTAAEAVYTVPAQPILNAGLESYRTTGNIDPWTITSSSMADGRIETINGVNPCTSGGQFCAGGSIVVRAYPPKVVGASSNYVALRQTFVAKPNTLYQFSFMYRCLNHYSGTTWAGMRVLYSGQQVGYVQCATPGAAFEKPNVGTFRTGLTGQGEIEVRFENPNPTLLPYLYFYADMFQATQVV